MNSPTIQTIIINHIIPQNYLNAVLSLHITCGTHVKCLWPNLLGVLLLQTIDAFRRSLYACDNLIKVLPSYLIQLIYIPYSYTDCPILYNQSSSMHHIQSCILFGLGLGGHRLRWEWIVYYYGNSKITINVSFSWLLLADTRNLILITPWMVALSKPGSI